MSTLYRSFFGKGLLVLIPYSKGFRLNLVNLFRDGTFSAIVTNVRHIGEVAATMHLPAGDKLAIPHVFSSEGSAAILPICLLLAVPAFPRIFPTMVFFCQVPITQLERASARSQIWRSHFWLCGFAIWCLCVGSVGRQHYIANVAMRPPQFFFSTFPAFERLRLLCARSYIYFLFLSILKSTF